jgi:hypothetical protein
LRASWADAATADIASSDTPASTTLARRRETELNLPLAILLPL